MFKKYLIVTLASLASAVAMPEIAYAGTTTINNPTVRGYSLDYCREWSQNCGWPAAHAYCQSRGYSRATDYRWIEDNQRTRVINGGQVCDAGFCDRISRVTCHN